jgi:hypothetical protein
MSTWYLVLADDAIKFIIYRQISAANLRSLFATGPKASSQNFALATLVFWFRFTK